MIADIIIILIAVLFLFLGIRRGAAKTLLNLAAVGASAVLSHFLASRIAEAVYNGFFRETVLSNLENAITQKGEQFAAQNSIDALPDQLKGITGFFTGIFGVKPEDLQGRLVPSSDVTGEIARAIEEPLAQLCTCVLTVLFTIIFFIVLMIVFKLLIRLALGFFEIPVIRQVNKILGGVLGAVEGVIFVVFLVNIFYIIMSYANPLLLENKSVFGSVFNALAIFK